MSWTRFILWILSLLALDYYRPRLLHLPDLLISIFGFACCVHFCVRSLIGNQNEINENQGSSSRHLLIVWISLLRLLLRWVVEIGKRLMLFFIVIRARLLQSFLLIISTDAIATESHPNFLNRRACFLQVIATRGRPFSGYRPLLLVSHMITYEVQVCALSYICFKVATRASLCHQTLAGHLLLNSGENKGVNTMSVSVFWSKFCRRSGAVSQEQWGTITLKFWHQVKWSSNSIWCTQTVPNTGGSRASKPLPAKHSLSGSDWASGKVYLGRQSQGSSMLGPEVANLAQWGHQNWLKASDIEAKINDLRVRTSVIPRCLSSRAWLVNYND